MSAGHGYEELFHRHASNPILTAADWPLRRTRSSMRVLRVYTTGPRCCSAASTIGAGTRICVPPGRRTGSTAGSSAAGCLYRLGAALYALDRPEHCLVRGDSWIFGPEAPYERGGDVGNVTFPCGHTLDADGDAINLYHGAADTCIALASGSIRRVLGWLDEHGANGGH